ncbi:triose-phosphate transporter family-domain-containing protein [Lineolata rhizophorae]|uniref:Triose-phosphate transporter family-domain-containing protein n=1 Tax=Lineolata rhizophorae TaxID=578093 RepID=A0A6A6NUZ2_9PEZI|nr:triose-phosphate transporter family-domain-containing protein [Lineolata rhizophorae]
MSASDEKARNSGEQPRAEAPQAPMLPTTNPPPEKAAEPSKPALHPAFYIAAWIGLSSSVIIFNKWILDTAKFHYPIFLTTWHLAFATLVTQALARGTTVLDSRHKVPMTGRVYLRAIVPIGVFFSLSLICGNVTYLYLSVSFIQMLKATTPVAVLLTTWALGVAPPNMKTLYNVSFIVIGVIIASFGEIKFVLVGFLFQVGGIVFEAIRLTMVQRLLSSAEFKMDPLVSLYYFAPACAVMNGAVCLVLEVPRMSLEDVARVGGVTLLINALVAFLLNVSVVMLIGKTSSLVLTLSGVLKDILLVVASMLFFGDPVSLLQAFGYSVALAGLLYYKLGGDALRDHAGHARRAWADYGARRPKARRALVLAAAAGLAALLLLAAGMGAGLAPRYGSVAAERIESLIGSEGAQEGGLEVGSS